MAVKKPLVTLEEYEAEQDENTGRCISCGAEAHGVEPDARQYECEECGRRTVYSLEELLIMGYVG